MKTYAAWTLGIVATISGWLWLVYGTGVSTDRYAPVVFNLHLATMAELLCMLGYALLIIGAIFSATDAIVDQLRAGKASLAKGSDDPGINDPDDGDIYREPRPEEIKARSMQARS